MTIFHFMLLFQLCYGASCNTVPQFGALSFNSKQSCEQYKNQFVAVANTNRFKFSAACQGPNDKLEATLSNGITSSFPKVGESQ